MATRKRILDFSTRTPNVSYDHTAVNGTTSSYTYSQNTFGITGGLHSCVDQVAPRFHLRKVRGETILGSLELIKKDRTWSDQTYTIGPHPTWGTRRVKGDLAAWFESKVADPITEISSITTQMRNLALTEAYSKVDPNTIMGGELLATMNDTVAMLRRPFGGSRDLLKRMIKSRDRSAGKSANAIAAATRDAWLEYRYGWQPLMMDMSSIINESCGLYYKVPKVRLVARAGNSYVMTKDVNFTVSYDVPQCDSVTGTLRAVKDLRVNAGVIYYLRVDDKFHAQSKYWGLRTYDGLATAWELIPFSFVADWFGNVGSFLQSITPNPYVEVQGNWVTDVLNETFDYDNCQGSTKIGTITYTGSITGGSHRNTVIRRNVNLPKPSHPERKLEITQLQAIDGLALLHSALTGQIENFRGRR